MNQFCKVGIRAGRELRTGQWDSSSPKFNLLRTLILQESEFARPLLTGFGAVRTPIVFKTEGIGD